MNSLDKKQDSNSPVFRTKEDVPISEEKEESILTISAKNPEVPQEKGDWKDNPILYKEEHKKPFALLELEVDGIYEELSDEVKDDATLIDSYFREQVQKKVYANNKKSYHDFFKELERKTESENNPLEIKLSKIKAFIKYLTEVQSL